MGFQKGKVVSFQRERQRFSNTYWLRDSLDLQALEDLGSLAGSVTDSLTSGNSAILFVLYFLSEKPGS